MGCFCGMRRYRRRHEGSGHNTCAGSTGAQLRLCWRNVNEADINSQTTNVLDTNMRDTLQGNRGGCDGTYSGAAQHRICREVPCIIQMAVFLKKSGPLSAFVSQRNAPLAGSSCTIIRASTAIRCRMPHSYNISRSSTGISLWGRSSGRLDGHEEYDIPLAGHLSDRSHKE